MSEEDIPNWFVEAFKEHTHIRNLRINGSPRAYKDTDFSILKKKIMDEMISRERDE